MTETNSDPDPKPKKRATVASVDAKVDEILEEMDGIRIEMSQIKSALKELALALVPSDKPKPPVDDGDWGIYG